MTNRLLTLRPGDCPINHLPLAAIAQHIPGFNGRNVRADTTDPNGRGPINVIVVGGGQPGTPEVYINASPCGSSWWVTVERDPASPNGGAHITIGEALAAACAIGPVVAEPRRDVLKTLRHAYVEGAGWEGSNADVAHLWRVLTELWVAFTPQAGDEDHQALDRACDRILD